jgi:hypothetical protein
MQDEGGLLKYSSSTTRNCADSRSLEPSPSIEVGADLKQRVNLNPGHCLERATGASRQITDVLLTVLAELQSERLVRVLQAWRTSPGE